MGSVRRAEAPAKLVRGLPAYPVRMVLLARLAVAHQDQGKGIGALLLAEALRKAVTAGEAVAARLVVVNPIDNEGEALPGERPMVRASDNPEVGLTTLGKP